MATILSRPRCVELCPSDLDGSGIEEDIFLILTDSLFNAIGLQSTFKFPEVSIALG